MARESQTTNPNATVVGQIQSWMHRPDPIEPFDTVLGFPADKLPDSEVA